MGKKKKRYEVFVYDPDEEDISLEEIDPAQQRLRLRMEKKGRGGKTVTIITGYQGLGLDGLAKSLKAYCGVGGSVKDAEIILQGDVRKKAITLLIKKGYLDVK